MVAWIAHRRLWALPGSVLSSAAFGELHISWQYIPRIKVLSGRAREGPFSERPPQLVKKGFDKLVDGEASSPATATLTSLR